MKEQQEFERIIKSGSIKEIREFTITNFHKIKHTLSFQLLIDRLERAEQTVKICSLCKNPLGTMITCTVCNAYNEKSLN